MWKLADVSPLPQKKKKPVKDLKKHLRPISLTPSISKIAQHFVVQHYSNPACSPLRTKWQSRRCSTTLVLMEMLHYWTEDIDGNGSTIRTVLFDRICLSVCLSIHLYIVQDNGCGATCNWYIFHLTDQDFRQIFDPRRANWSVGGHDHESGLESTGDRSRDVLAFKTSPSMSCRRETLCMV